MIKKTIIILIIFLLTGCYDHKELNSIAILTATEINKINNEYIVTAQVVNPQSPDKTTNVQAPFVIYKGKGKTIQEAYRQIKLQSSRFLYANHLQIIIINEKIAKEDISQIIDFYQRYPSLRTEFNVIIGKDEDILSITTPIDIISSTSILESLETSNKFLGISNIVTFNEMTSMSLNPNLEIILPSIKATKEEKGDTTENTESTKVKSIYKLSGLGIFKNNKLIGYLNEEESLTYNILKNEIQNAILTYECEKDKYIVLETINNNSKISIKNKEINIELNISGNINETSCNINLDNNKSLKKLEKDFSKDLNNKITNNINTIRKTYNSDIFGFLETIYKHDYKTYKKVKNNWYEEEYKNIKINLKTTVNIIGKGNILEGNNEKN